jgi:hypothetical protein
MNASLMPRIVVAFITVDQPRLWEWSGKGTLLLSSYLDEIPLNSSIVLRKSEGLNSEAGLTTSDAVGR